MTGMAPPALNPGHRACAPVRCAGTRQAVEAAIALGAEEAEAYYYRADAILNTNPPEIEPAYVAVERALRLNPADAFIQTLAGCIDGRRGTDQAAITHLKRAVELMPSIPMPHVHLAGLYARAGLEKEAAAEAEAARKLSAGDRTDIEPPTVMKTLFQVRAPR
jgi:tetratricopeptide (TPR) repeat protein